MVAETRTYELSAFDLVPILDPDALCLLPPYVLWKPWKPGLFVALSLQCHAFSLDSSVQPIHEDTAPGLGAAIMADICHRCITASIQFIGCDSRERIATSDALPCQVDVDP